MTLSLERAIGDGARRALTRTGAVVLVAFLAIQLVSIGSYNTVMVAYLPTEAAQWVGLTLPLPGTVALGLMLAGYIVVAGFTVVVARAYARPVEALSTFPAELYTRRIVPATLVVLVGGIIVMIAIFIGFLLLIIPGIFLATCFLFFIFAVGVEDRGLIEGLRRSWDLSRGNRINLGILVILTAIVGWLIGLATIPVRLAVGQVANELISIVLMSALFVVLYGIIAEAYLQVIGDDEAGIADGDELDTFEASAT